MKLDAATITKLIVLFISIAAIVALALLHAVTGAEALDKIEVLATVGIGSLGLVSVTGILAQAFGSNMPAHPDARPAVPATVEVVETKASDDATVVTTTKAAAS